MNWHPVEGQSTAARTSRLLAEGTIYVTSHPAPPASEAPPLHAAWQTLADGLMTQRLHLHLDEWRTTLAAGGHLPDIGDVTAAQLSARPAAALTTPALAALQAGGFEYWYELPHLYGPECTGPGNPLQHASRRTGESLTSEAAHEPWAVGVAAVCDAAAWWVGFFAVLRHRGVHHVTLEPHPGPLHVQALSTAVHVVAVGMATRLLEAVLHSTDSSSARVAYCQAIEYGIAAERDLPELLDELAELRLVDLVSTAARWRGRFTKYAGGTGAGQVE